MSQECGKEDSYAAHAVTAMVAVNGGLAGGESGCGASNHFTTRATLPMLLSSWQPTLLPPPALIDLMCSVKMSILVTRRIITIFS